MLLSVRSLTLKKKKKNLTSSKLSLYFQHLFFPLPQNKNYLNRSFFIQTAYLHFCWGIFIRWRALWKWASKNLEIIPIKICPHLTHHKEKAQICEGRNNAKIIQYESNFHISLCNFAIYDNVDLKSVMVNTFSNANVKGISLECMQNMSLI